MNAHHNKPWWYECAELCRNLREQRRQVASYPRAYTQAGVSYEIGWTCYPLFERGSSQLKNPPCRELLLRICTYLKATQPEVDAIFAAAGYRSLPVDRPADR